MRNNVYKTTAIITILSAIERTLGFLYRVVLSRFIGAEGLGLYQVALSLFAVFLTIGTGGIPVTISRLKTKGYAEGKRENGDCALAAGALFSLLLTLPVCLFFFLFGKRTGFLFSDERCIPLFTLLLIGLPFTCVYADIRGSFWGDKKFFQPALTELFEETVMVIAGVLLLGRFSPDNFGGAADAAARGTYFACLAVVISYFASFTASVILFFVGGGKIRSPKTQFKPLFSSAAPITAVRACSTLIGSAVAVILPAMLIRSGLSSSEALRTFGVAAGMAMPVLSIPSTFIGSVSLVLTPEFSESFYKKRTDKLTADIGRGVYAAFAFSCLFMPFFFVYGLPLGELLYSDRGAGEMIAKCAFMLLPMSVSLISTGILNSMNYEKQTLRFYFIGAALMPQRTAVVRALHIDPKSRPHKLLRVVVTFVLFSSTMVFFRAYRLMDAVRIFISMLTVHNFEIFTDGSIFACGIDAFNFALLGIYVLVIFAADVCKYKRIKVRSVIEKQHWLCQVAVVALGVLTVLLLGVYGPGFEASNFIYSQF